jgi:hypothetical protein
MIASSNGLGFVWRQSNGRFNRTLTKIGHSFAKGFTPAKRMGGA